MITGETFARVGRMLSRVRWGLGVIGASLMVLSGGVAQAQSLEDTVKQHVDEGIDRSRDKQRKQKQRAAHKPKPKPKRKPKKKKKARGKPPKSKPGTGATSIEDADVSISIGGGMQPDEQGKPAPKLPHRFFPKYVQLDVAVGGGYRGWVPQQYEHVAVDVGHYFTWNVRVRARLFKLIALREGYYESNALSGPRNDEAAILAQAGSHIPKAAWLLGTIGFPILKIWEPIIRYESRAFRTRAVPTQPVCIVPRKDVPQDLADCPRTTEDLDIVSGFETLVLGVRYNQSKDPDIVIEEPKDRLPPLFFGVGLMQYEKPYQLVIDGATLDDLLFDARFRGAGLAFGTSLGGGLNRFGFNFNVQAGVGEVKLTDDLSLNEVIPSDWIVGYVQGSGNVGIAIPLWRFAPTVMFKPSATFGGAAFYLIDTDIEEGEQATTPNVNWDFLWSAQAELVLSL